MVNSVLDCVTGWNISQQIAIGCHEIWTRYPGADRKIPKTLVQSCWLFLSRHEVHICGFVWNILTAIGFDTHLPIMNIFGDSLTYFCNILKKLICPIVHSAVQNSSHSCTLCLVLNSGRWHDNLSTVWMILDASACMSSMFHITAHATSAKCLRNLLLQ